MKSDEDYDVTIPILQRLAERGARIDMVSGRGTCPCEVDLMADLQTLAGFGYLVNLV